ncbi:MAG: hypothetical protein K0R57_479 [Paenibacillaceae bacterium]|nr:hypothetical protein [Paenibacillaceae bacterium]
MDNKPYYLAYEDRYQKVFGAGAERWGHSPDDEVLISTLEKWVHDNHLQGKKIIEFACGEGACGVILSRLGCMYHGVDIAPSAVEKSKAALREFPHAMVSQLNMVNDQIDGTFDAALDVMGLHMLVTDADRSNYLEKACYSLNPGAPMLFFREAYRTNAYEGKVDSFEDWKSITGSNYDAPERRTAKCGDTEVEVWIPLVPARARSKDGYIAEMREAGFIVDDLVEMDSNQQCVYSASIFVRKPAAKD